MKLFYLADTIYSPAGMERVLITKANLLATRYGYDVTIVTNHQKGRPTFFPLDPHVKHIDLNVNTHLPWNMPRYMRRLKALVKAEKPDIVDSLCSKELTRLHELKGLCKVVMGNTLQPYNCLYPLRAPSLCGTTWCTLPPAGLFASCLYASCPAGDHPCGSEDTNIYTSCRKNKLARH